VQSDAELLVRVAAGEVDAYAVLVRRYERLVRAMVLRKMSDRHQADDVVQETFLIAFQSLATLNDSARFGPWLLGIARNRTARSYRNSTRREIGIDDLDALPNGNRSQLSEESMDLLELIEKLPEHERVLVGLRHFEGHTAAEIAAITGRPVGTVTKQLSRAHARLAKWLKQEARQ
jgi:RNA polymerase sigma-70 factor (ECF subfamily)